MRATRWHAAAAAGALLMALTGCGSDGTAETAGPTAAVLAVRTDLEIAVRALGELEALQASPIAVPPVPTGALKVKEVASEGSMVEEGEVILIFDDTQLNIDLTNHVATFRSVGRRIDRTHIDWGIESGSIDVVRRLAEMERDFATEFELEDDLIYSRKEILEAALDKEYAEEKILFANGKLLLRGEYYDIDERILNVEKEQTQGKIGRVETSLGKLVLTAPISGMVAYKKNWRGATVSVGDTLWPGNVVLSIVDPSRTALKVNILEKDAAGVKVGARAEVRIDARAERAFAGVVTHVSELSRPIERGSPVKYFEARVELDEGDPELLKPGMKGEARILVAELENALVIPRSAVHGTEGTYHVMVASASGHDPRRVELGPGDLVRVSVTEGLEGTEQVLLGDLPDAPDLEPEPESTDDAPAEAEAEAKEEAADQAD
jgi:HlyD family secretion protein